MKDPEKTGNIMDRKKQLENWWWYHKKIVLLTAAAVLIVCYFIFQEKGISAPDYHIAIVSREKFTEDSLDDLAAIFAEYGTDINGDGTVTVRVHPYYIDLTSPEMSADRNTIAEYTALEADFQAVQSGIFLTNEPESFSRLFGDFDFYETDLFGLYIGFRPLSGKETEKLAPDKVLFALMSSSHGNTPQK